MKQALLNLAGRLGYTILPTWRQPGLPLATLTREILARHRIDLIVDVGANAGQYRDFLRDEVFWIGDIVSFEPQSDMVELLERRSTNDDKWKILNLALGSEERLLSLNVMAMSSFTSFLEPDNAATPQFSDWNKVAKTEVVQVSRLDKVALPFEGKRLLLKLDTQGFDREVFRGSSGILDNIFAIQTEIPVEKIYKGLPHYAEILLELETIGFAPAGFFPVTRAADCSAIEFDCLLVKKDMLTK